MKLFVVLLSVLLAGCVSTPQKIVATPSQAGLPIPITNPTIITRLQADAYNLDQAVAIGALAKDDPAPSCMHDFLQKAGIEIIAGTEPPKSFVPKKEGIGSILYIEAQQAKAIAGGIGGLQISTPCYAIIGKFTVDAATTAYKAAKDILPLGRFLP